jgi:hypothetical protein
MTVTDPGVFGVFYCGVFVVIEYETKFCRFVNR